MQICYKTIKISSHHAAAADFEESWFIYYVKENDTRGRVYRVRNNFLWNKMRRFYKENVRLSGDMTWTLKLIYLMKYCEIAIFGFYWKWKFINENLKITQIWL